MTVGHKVIVVNIKDLQQLYIETPPQTKRVLEEIFTKDIFKDAIEKEKAFLKYLKENGLSKEYRSRLDLMGEDLI